MQARILFFLVSCPYIFGFLTGWWKQQEDAPSACSTSGVLIHCFLTLYISRSTDNANISHVQPFSGAILHRDLSTGAEVCVCCSAGWDSAWGHPLPWEITGVIAPCATPRQTDRDTRCTNPLCFFTAINQHKAHKRTASMAKLCPHTFTCQHWLILMQKPAGHVYCILLFSWKHWMFWFIILNNEVTLCTLGPYGDRCN